MRSSFESIVCLEKYGLSGWVTRTSRPSIESTSAASSFLTKTGYTYLLMPAKTHHAPNPHERKYEPAKSLATIGGKLIGLQLGALSFARLNLRLSQQLIK